MEESYNNMLMAAWRRQRRGLGGVPWVVIAAGDRLQLFLLLRLKREPIAIPTSCLGTDWSCC